MTIQLDLPPSLEDLLREEAARQDQEPGEYVREVLRRELVLPELERHRKRKRPTSLDEVQPKVPPPPGKSWLDGVAGQWPGDETDEEIYRALEELS